MADVGGHDLALILDAYAAAARERERPSVILAHTIKGWGLPFAGDPLNHTMVTSPAQMEELRAAFGVAPGEEWAGFAPGTPEANLIRALPPLFSAPPARPAPVIPDCARRELSRRDLDAGGVRSGPGRAGAPAGGRCAW